MSRGQKASIFAVGMTALGAAYVIACALWPVVVSGTAIGLVGGALFVGFYFIGWGLFA